MLIKHTFKGMVSEEVVSVTEDNMCSPNGGYTQKYAEECGKNYAEHDAEERFGEHDFWEWQSSEYVK